MARRAERLWPEKALTAVVQEAYVQGGLDPNRPVASNAEALQILVPKAEQGNKRAAELLEEFRQAASVVDLDD